MKYILLLAFLVCVVSSKIVGRPPGGGPNSCSGQYTIGALRDVAICEFRPGNKRGGGPMVKPGNDLVWNGTHFVAEDYKITLCHNPNGPSPQTITISAHALAAHLAHGDTEGVCPDCFCSLDELDDTDMIDMATTFDHLGFNLTGTEKWKPHDAMRLGGSDASLLPNGNTLEVVGTTNLGDPDSNTATGLNAVTIGNRNTASNNNAAAVGGTRVRATAPQSFGGGGFNNQATGLNSAVVGGANGQATNQQTFVGGGFICKATGALSGTLAGGDLTASGDFAANVGGQRTTSSGNRALCGGGRVNQASGRDSTALGGFCNNATIIHSSVFGTNTGAGTTIASMAIGHCNEDTGALFMIGNGVVTDPNLDLNTGCGCNSTSNAMEVSEAGDLTIAGDLDVKGSCGKCGGAPAVRITVVALTTAAPVPVPSGSPSIALVTCPAGTRVGTWECTVAATGPPTTVLESAGYRTPPTVLTPIVECRWRNVGLAPSTFQGRVTAYCEPGPLP